MPGLELMPGLLWVHNNNYIYMVLLSLFLSSFFQLYYRCLTADNRAPLCNIIPRDLWIKFWGVRPTVWELFITATYCKFVLICWQAPSLGRVVLLLLATTQTYKNSDYKPRCPFHGVQYLLDLLHKCHQLPLEFIAQNALIKNFN